MEIKLQDITIRELVDSYVDNNEDGIRGFGGKLDIRPPYQREFIYNERQREAVIITIQKGFPLNVMYWAKRDENNEIPYEIIDGQQRTISICQYINGDFPVDMRFFDNLTTDEKEQILSYKLMIYVCSGTDREKLKWFETINIAGEKLTNQELRNAVYAGTWVTDAKKYFSKNGCVAYQIANKYMSGTCIRQDYLETVIKWINNNYIEAYMAKHQRDTNANEIWLYFQNVINWVKLIFPKYRKEMKSVAWGELYNKYRGEKLDAKELENKISKLMADSDVTKKSGIYEYVLDGQEKHLNIRVFDDNMKREAYEKQEGICPICKKHFEIEEMEADHITPWCEGGKTRAENCQMLCKEDNRRKSNK